LKCPEPEDDGLTATLVREACEENQVRIGATAYLGPQEALSHDRAPYPQVRMAGIIDEFAARTVSGWRARVPAADHFSLPLLRSLDFRGFGI
jgi:hypothetical protein